MKLIAAIVAAAFVLSGCEPKPPKPKTDDTQSSARFSRAQ